MAGATHLRADGARPRARRTPLDELLDDGAPPTAGRRPAGRRARAQAATPGRRSAGATRPGRAGSRARGGPADAPGGRSPGRGRGGGGGRGSGGRGPGGRGPGRGDGDGDRRSRDGGRKRSILWRWRRPLFLIGLAMLAAVAGVGVVLAQTELPELDDLQQSSYICAADVAPGECDAGNAMARMQSDENRTNVPLDEVPDIVVQAVIAMEDRDFFEHDGVNPMGIARALYQNIKGGGISQGGSTITQQYVKIAFDLTTERSISRKIKEAILSIKLEQQMSKEEILEGYLNTIFFGRGAYGIAAASQAYFGIDVREITDPGQAAFLAGVIRAPALAEPTKYPEEADRRRHTGLVAMQEEGYITAEQVAQAEAVPVAQQVRPYSPVRLVETLRGAAPEDYMGTDYLPAFIREELRRIDPERFTDEMIDLGGLRIYTSIDYEMQRAAWQAVTSTLNLEEDPEAALVAVDDQGLIRAMVGSRHPYQAGQYEANYAVRGNGSNGREPGSTFKPLVLAEALREGYSLKSRYNAQGTMEFDDPAVLSVEGEPWRVSNYSESDAGVMDLVEATAQSSNTAYAQLMIDLGLDMVDPDGDGTYLPSGPQKVAELAAQMGLHIDSAQITPAMVLGTVNATPLEMAGIYSTFANRGVYRQPQIITRVERVDQEGRRTVLYERQVTERRVLSETQADLLNYALQAPLQEGGTGRAAWFGKPAAGKTGTSQRNRNAWFAGYVPRLTAVVWMGYPNADYDDPETPEQDNELWPMNEDGRLVHGRVATGGSFPAEIWRKFMEQATAGMDDEFVEVTPEQIAAGEVINEGELLTDEEAATTTTTTVEEDRRGPDWSLPDMTVPTVPRPRGPRPGPTTPPSTSEPPDESTTTSTVDDGPPGPGPEPTIPLPTGGGG